MITLRLAAIVDHLLAGGWPSRQVSWPLAAQAPRPPQRCGPLRLTSASGSVN